MRGEHGRWQPGCESPNPGGRPKGSLRQFRALCIQAAPEVLETLLSIAGDDHAKPGDRIAASALILDRAFGKARVDDDEEADDSISREERVLALISPGLRARLMSQSEADRPKVLALTTSKRETVV